MHGSTFKMMYEHVRAIHRAVTGNDPPEPAPVDDTAYTITPEALAHRFAELESVARSIATVAERVPPFSFAPPLDLMGTERELIAELGVPGIERRDVSVELIEGRLVISGARGVELPGDGRVYFHAEMARGPFRREIGLPLATKGEPRIEVDNGVVRIRLAKASRSAPPRA